MLILLKLLTIYIFFAFIILGLFFSKIKINIRYFECENMQNKLKAKFNVNVALFLYGRVKIFGINFNEFGINFLWKKFSYRKIKNSKIFLRFSKIQITDLEKNIKISELKTLKPRLEKLDLSLDLGFENILLTSFMIFVISTMLSVAVKESASKYNPTKYKYVITPHYRENNMIYLKANCIITIKMTHIINILLNYKKRRVRKYERTSYRRSYENSYE